MGLVIAWTLIEIIYFFYRLSEKNFTRLSYPEYKPPNPKIPTYTPPTPPQVVYDLPVEEMETEINFKPYERIVTDPTPEVWDIVKNLETKN